MRNVVSLGALLEDPRIRKLGCRAVRAPAARKDGADLSREFLPLLWKSFASFALVARANETARRSVWCLWKKKTSNALYLSTRPWEPSVLWVPVEDVDSVLAALGPPTPRPPKIGPLVEKLGAFTKSSGDVGVLDRFYLADPDQMIATMKHDIQSLDTLEFPPAIVDDAYYEDPRTFLPGGGRPSLMQRRAHSERDIWLWCSFRACVAIAGEEQVDLSSVTRRVRLVYVRDRTAANAAGVARVNAAMGTVLSTDVPFDVALVASSLEADEGRARAHVEAHQARVDQDA